MISPELAMKYLLVVARSKFSHLAYNEAAILDLLLGVGDFYPEYVCEIKSTNPKEIASVIHNIVTTSIWYVLGCGENSEYYDYEEGPYGGAFSSWEDYYRYRGVSCR